MGGNALKSVSTRRYQKDEYEEIKNEVLYKLNKKNIICQSTISYKSKDSFGDLDILVLKRMDMDEFIPIARDIFQPKEEYRNGNCFTINYKELQVDFILIKPEEWDTSIVYYSYNELSNFMGRIARKLGFRYGNYGLAYTFPEGERVIVSRNVKKIFTFLGFNHDRYLQGFNTLEDIFNYVIDSEYYNKELFLFKNLNHPTRARNMKRKSYIQFVEYIQTKKITKEDYSFNNKEFYLTMAFNFFDEEAFKVRYDEIVSIKNLKMKAKEFFNGNLISLYYPNVDHKEYSFLISNYRRAIEKIINSDDELCFEKYLINIGDPELIMNEFGYINNLN